MRTLGYWCFLVMVAAILAGLHHRWPGPTFVALALYVLREPLATVRPS